MTVNAQGRYTLEHIKGNVFTYTTKHNETRKQALSTENCLVQVQVDR